MNQEELQELATVINMVSAVLEDAKAANQMQSTRTLESADALDRAIRENRDALKHLLSESETIIQKGAVNAFDSVTDTLEKRINSLCDRVDRSSHQMDKASNAATKHTKVSGWVTLTGLIVAAVAVVSFTGWYGWNQKQVIEERTQYYNNIEHSIAVKKALSQLAITTCGGRPCVKLDAKAQRYGQEGEYILIAD